MTATKTYRIRDINTDDVIHEITTDAAGGALERFERGPVVLVESAAGGSWLVMGLTTLAVYADGNPRVPVPNPARVGLNQAGFLWGERLTMVRGSSIGRHVGWADDGLVDAIARLVGRSEFEVMALRPYNQDRKGVGR